MPVTTAALTDPLRIHATVQRHRKYRKHFQNLAFDLFPEIHHTCLNSATITQNITDPPLPQKTASSLTNLQLICCQGSVVILLSRHYPQRAHSQLHSEFSISFNFYLTQLFWMNISSINCSVRKETIKTWKTKILKHIHFEAFKIKYVL